MAFNTVDISRRGILKTLAAAGALTTVPGLGQLAFAAPGGAQDANGKILVVLFFRGGMDVLNFIGPSNDAVYIDARPADLRLLDSGDKAGIPLDSDLAHGVDFRLHPEAAALHELYRHGDLAIVHATGLANATRSHFEAQELMERGLADEPKGNGALGTEGGWVARLLRQMGGDGELVAISTAGGVPKLLQGYPEALSIPDLRGGFGLPGGPSTQAVLERLYPAGPATGFNPNVARGGRVALDAALRLNAALPKGPDGKVLPYQPEHGGTFDGDVGRSLETVARLIRMDAGLKVACVDMGGWDTHEGQSGRFKGLVHQLSGSLSTFWNDLSAYHDRITLVTISEFGRRLRANRSGGTDHGHGSLMMVMGGGVAGGRLLGRWPGLQPQDLDERVDLAVTTDYRDVLTSVLKHRMGVGQVDGVFPGFHPGSGDPALFKA
ncbi:DUF1501 domain-containing protein [Nitrospirillum sp. BR 11752]|uniref:DUF1501 domain-containing protein n=1 Tax=Nitrospirillum sp. BR 11752 TaxID=3104293 RepID=UPI002EC52893|nr:DUF1501 domain-containing protein [Nitrospirillum sp. BR 11752]